jgi:type IV pilus assembly protein PilB
VNTVTVGDPVEYRVPGAYQVQVNEKRGLTFPTALRSILRSDPDIIMVGEIRDEVTAQLVIQAR